MENNKKIKIAILNITSGGISGGYLKYLINMVPLLAKHRRVDSILYAVPRELDFENPFENYKNLKKIYCKPFNPFSIISDRDLMKNIEDFKPDIIFIPLARYFKYKKVPIVTMLQNMEPFVDRRPLNDFRINFKLFIQKIIGKKALLKSDAIIFLSKYIKKKKKNKLDITRKKTSKIYHGVSENKLTINENLSLDKKTIPNEFIFTAGSIRPARGLEDLIIAAHYLKQENINIKILIAGAKNRDSKKYLKYLNKLIFKYNLSDSIKFLGNINNHQMSQFYSKSKVFVMTSRVESFGMIAAEAMLNGSLCLSSDSSCLPEIFNDGAYYYRSGDSEELAQAIKKLVKLSDDEIRIKKLLAKERAAFFSWDICAKKTVDLLLKISNK